MTIKVVINRCYGGFGISQECAERMSELGSTEAKELLANKDSWEVFDDSPPTWYGSLSCGYPRHCDILIQAVEELGAEASGWAANLTIVSIEGDRYIINEYDGLEGITTPDSIKWIKACKTTSS